MTLGANVRDPNLKQFFRFTFSVRIRETTLQIDLTFEVSQMMEFLIAIFSVLFLLNTSEAALSFATPVRGFSSSAQWRSASMPRMFNNNPHQTIIGGSAAYRGVWFGNIIHMSLRILIFTFQDFHRTPYYNAPTGNYLQPSFIKTAPVGGFGSTHNTLSSILGIPIPPIPSPVPGYINPGSPCPMSPFAQYLTTEQQDALHELIIEARKAGASESEVKTYTERYVKEILPPEKFTAFQKANADFERRLTFFRRGKRSTDSIRGLIPSRFDQYSFRTRKTKKAPQKVEFPDKNAFFDYTEVQRNSQTLDDLVELI